MHLGQLLCEIGVPMSVLPAIRSSSEVYCVGAEGTPLHNVRIAGILGDQQAALFGQAGLERGSAKNTYGTGCFTLCNVGSEKPVPSNNGLLTTVAYKLGPDARTFYALEGSIPFAGACLDWVSDKLGAIQSAADSTAVMNQSDNGDVYFVPALCRAVRALLEG